MLSVMTAIRNVHLLYSARFITCSFRIGSSMDDFLKHAQHLWSFLDHLAETNPDQYKQFIMKQTEAAGLTKVKNSRFPFL